MEKLRKIAVKIRDTAKKVRTDYRFYKALLEKPQSKAAFSLVKGQLCKLFAKIRPRKVEGEVIFGMGDPAETGQALGVAAIFYGFYPEKLRIVPDFEEKRLEGELRLQGGIRLIHLLMAALRLFADKNVRYTIKKITAHKNLQLRQKSKEDET